MYNNQTRLMFTRRNNMRRETVQWQSPQKRNLYTPIQKRIRNLLFFLRTGLNPFRHQCRLNPLGWLSGLFSLRRTAINGLQWFFIFLPRLFALNWPSRERYVVENDCHVPPFIRRPLAAAVGSWHDVITKPVSTSIQISRRTDHFCTIIVHH